MTRLLLLILVLGLQEYCLGTQKNETRILGQASTQLKPTGPSVSNFLHASSNGGLGSPGDTGTDPAISTTPKYTTFTSNPRDGIKTAAIPSPATSPIPRKGTIAITSRNERRTTENPTPSKSPVHIEAKAVTPLSDNVGSPTNSSPSQKTLISVTNDGKNYETHRLSRKRTLPKTNATRAIEARTNRPTTHTSSASRGAEPSLSTTAESSTGMETLTSEETSTEEDNSTTDSYNSDTNGTTVENADDNNLSYTTADAFFTDYTTPDWTTEQTTEDSTAQGPSTPNGHAPREHHPIPGVSLPLTKLILRLSKPGVFEKGKSVFEEDPSATTTSCPPGDVGLPCRRAEARRTADECSGGNCEVCRSCNNMAAIDWPHCCRENFRCCSELALACQQCDQPSLQVFCNKHFKRCF